MDTPHENSTTAPVADENTPAQNAVHGGWLNRLRRFIVHIKANKKQLFWYWIAYQAIKGTLTTSLIWVPLLVHWLHR